MQNRQDNDNAIFSEKLLSLPILKILSNSSIKTLTNLNFVNFKSYLASQSESVWRKKFQQHFPHLYKKLTLDDDFNWKIKFAEAYKTEYKNLPPHIKKLFSLIKEKKFAEFKTMKINLDDLNYEDSNEVPLWKWIRRYRNQDLLNHIYLSLIPYYTTQEKLLAINKKDQDNHTILDWAILCNQHPQVINNLLMKGGRLDSLNFERGYTSLHLACMTNNLNILKLFLEKDPAAINLLDTSGQTPAIWAAHNNHLQIVEYLAANHADLNVGCYRRFDKYSGYNPLLRATEKGHTEIVKCLIKHNVRLDYQATSSAGPNAMHIACEHGHLDIVKILLEKDPNLLNSYNNFYQTPLHYAAKHGHVELVRYLVEEQNAVVSSTMPTVASHNGHLDVVKILLKKNPSLLNTQDWDGKTPVFYAASNGHAEVVTYLTSLGADVNIPCNDRQRNFTDNFTPLHEACRKGHTKSIKVLLINGANPIRKSLDGKTPSQIAASSLHAKELKLYEFLAKLKTKPENSYRRSFSIFGHQFHFGNTVKVEKNAALAMKDVFEGKAELESLEPHKKVIESCELISIRKGLGF